MKRYEFHLQTNDVVNRLKLQHSCECGCSYPECFEFHHFKKKHKPVGKCNRKELIRELKRCVLICANCHTRIHKGTLPNPTITNINMESVEQILDTVITIAGCSR